MKKRHIFSVCLLCLGLLGEASGASPKFSIDDLLPKESENTLGLRELIEGAKNNYQVLAKNDGIAKSEAEKMSAYLEFGPSITASYGYGYQTNPSVSDYTGSQKAKLRMDYDLYTGFSSVNKVKQKYAEVRASIAEKKYTLESLCLQIVQEYYAYFTNYSNLTSLKQKKKLLVSNVKRLQKLYNSGLSTINDVEALKAEASLTEYQIAQAELDLEQNRLNLALLSSQNVKEIYRTTLSDPKLKNLSVRSDIIALSEQAQSIDYQKRQVTYAPTISVYDEFSYSPDGGLSNLNPNAKTNNTIGISVSMQFDSMSRYMQKEALGLSYLQAMKNVAYKKEEQKRDIKLYYKSLQIAKAKIKSAEAGLKSAMIAFENVSKQYDAQLVNYVDYLNALSQKFTAEATYVESLNNYEIQKANFVFYSGQDLQSYIK